jgi:hypothetical protein
MMNFCRLRGGFKISSKLGWANGARLACAFDGARGLSEHGDGIRLPAGCSSRNAASRDRPSPKETDLCSLQNMF